MFTGLITHLGTIKDVKIKDKDAQFLIESEIHSQNFDIGASIACSGVCLTVTEKNDFCFSVDVSQETLQRTTLKNWQPGTIVNIEQSLRGNELGGHFVFGHVDALTTLLDFVKVGDSYHLICSLPKGYEAYVAEKGSVAIDGISLTVNKVEADRFHLMIIPHTWDNTTLKHRKPGDQLHFEVDMLARYAVRYLQTVGEAAA